MTDPDAAEDIPPPPPPRREQPQQLSQLEEDERLARQLAEHYEALSSFGERTSSRTQGSVPRRQQTGLDPVRAAAQNRGAHQQYGEHGDRERSFIDDDLPVIRDNIRKTFVDAQVQANKFFTTLKKKWDEEIIGDDDDGQQRPPGGPRRQGENGAGARRSNDYHRYDADPEVLSDDFAGMKFHADGSKLLPQKNPRRYHKEVVGLASVVFFLVKPH
jgi:hypothetical protein